MKWISLPAIKRVIAIFSAFVLPAQVCHIPILAEEAQNEKACAISQLADEINYFYLHPNATDFMISFYTRESYQHLRAAFNQAIELKIPNWATELDDTTLTELYHLLRSALTNLRPLVIRRGEAIAQGQNLNFRSTPAVSTQVLYTLSYGTSFEIVDEVQGGIVVGDDLVEDDRWFRIRHDDQPGYVHVKYVRNLPVSEERIWLLTEIGRQELLIRSKIDGWRTVFSLKTINELWEILNSARDSQIENWQFELSYSELNDILENLSLDHLNLVTLIRYNLINDIVRLKQEIKNNIQGSGSARIENYTEASWAGMDAIFEMVQTLLIEGWQENLDDEDLESIYELLLSGLNGLELIPQPELISENDDDLIENEASSGFTIEGRLRMVIFALAGLIGTVLIFTITKSILYRR